MTEDAYVSFRYEDLVHMERTRQRPAGYVAKVMRSARRRGPDVIMSMDAYKAFQANYKSVTNIYAEHQRSKSIIVPRTMPRRILAPNGKPLASGCCGGQSTKILQTA